MPTFNYIVLKNILKGEIVGVDSFLGALIPARSNDIRLGMALRDLHAGEVLGISFIEDTEEISRSALEQRTPL